MTSSRNSPGTRKASPTQEPPWSRPSTSPGRCSRAAMHAGIDAERAAVAVQPGARASRHAQSPAARSASRSQTPKNRPYRQPFRIAPGSAERRTGRPCVSRRDHPFRGQAKIERPHAVNRERKPELPPPPDLARRLHRRCCSAATAPAGSTWRASSKRLPTQAIAGLNRDGSVRRLHQSGGARLSVPHRPLLRQPALRRHADDKVAASAAAFRSARRSTTPSTSSPNSTARRGYPVPAAPLSLRLGQSARQRPAVDGFSRARFGRGRQA